MNEFAHGKCDSQFMNLAFNINPVLLTTVPYSTLGTGMILPPTKDPNQAIVSFMVLSSTGTAGVSGSEILVIISSVGFRWISFGGCISAWSQIAQVDRIRCESRQGSRADSGIARQV